MNDNLIHLKLTTRSSYRLQKEPYPRDCSSALFYTFIGGQEVQYLHIIEAVGLLHRTSVPALIVQQYCYTDIYGTHCCCYIIRFAERKLATKEFNIQRAGTLQMLKIRQAPSIGYITDERVNEFSGNVPLSGVHSIMMVNSAQPTPLSCSPLWYIIRVQKLCSSVSQTKLLSSVQEGLKGGGGPSK